MGLWILGRQWCDFIMFDPRLEAVGKSVFVKRVQRDDDFIERMETGLMTFARLVDDYRAVLLRADTVQRAASKSVKPMQRAPLKTSALPIVNETRYQALERRALAAPSRAAADLILDAASDLPADEYSALFKVTTARFRTVSA